MATKSRVWPDTPTHPGEVLADEMEARGIFVDGLAERTKLPSGELGAVLRGERDIDAATAWALEAALAGISARFWMGLQADYALATERLRALGSGARV